MVTGRKLFKLWPANATESFYPAPELKSGVKQSWIDAWNEVSFSLTSPNPKRSWQLWIP